MDKVEWKDVEFKLFGKKIATGIPIEVERLTVADKLDFYKHMTQSHPKLCDCEFCLTKREYESKLDPPN